MPFDELDSLSTVARPRRGGLAHPGTNYEYKYDTQTKCATARSLTFLFGAAAVAALFAIAPSRAVNPSRSHETDVAMSKIAPWVIEHTAGIKRAEYLVVLADQADLKGAEALQ